VITLLGFELTTGLIFEIILANALIVALAIYGFKNIRKYIGDIRVQIKRIRDKLKEL
jgi:hypothetical protein